MVGRLPWNWWNDDNESNLHRMDRKGMAKYADFKIIFTSAKIVNSPAAYLKSMPADLKAAIREAFFKVNEKAPEAFKRLTDGKARPWDPTTHAEYAGVVELIKFVDALKRKKN